MNKMQLAADNIRILAAAIVEKAKSGHPGGAMGGADPASKIWGLRSFGFSAPYKVLDEKLGYTAENVYQQVKQML